MDTGKGQGQKKRIVFMGTPEFAQVSLEYLFQIPETEVTGVCTQPDRPCGRGQICMPSAVKKLALDTGLPILQPEHFKQDEAGNKAFYDLENLQPDLLVVTAYGLILPKRVLALAPFGAVNVHASLLPKYRGAAPIQRALQNGEKVTGVTLMQMDEGMDTGDIIATQAVPVHSCDTACTLHWKLAKEGGKLLAKTLPALFQGNITPVKQDNREATYAPKLKKEEGGIDFSRPAQTIHNHIRAMHPWPGAFFVWEGAKQGRDIRVCPMPGVIGPKAEDLGFKSLPQPGTFMGLVDKKLAIACADRTYLFSEIKPAGKKVQTAVAFACGYLDICVEL